MVDLKKYNGTAWVDTTLRQYKTATADIEPTIYTDGTAITAYALKGNEEHTGTPSPQNPVIPNGVGNKTANLFDKDNATVIGSYIVRDTGVLTYSTTARSVVIPCQANTTYTVSKTKGSRFTVGCYDSNPSNGDTATNWIANQEATSITIATTANSQYLVVFFYYTPSETETYQQVLATLMMNTGSTAKPYEPYGYKIPILTNQTTTNIYLGSVQSTRQITKLVLTGNETLSYQVQPPLFIINIPTNHFIPRVTALCTEYNYNPAQSSILANSQHGDFGLQYVNVRDEYNVWFNNSTYATNDDFKTYLAQQYANGTPVTVWYVLATPETATVNEPLMKIGDYADTLSNATAIPTTEGANSITVDTTVQPSEFTATWTGWHDSSVQEYDGSDWN